MLCGKVATMRCYYCARRIEENEKAMVVGHGKSVHEECYEPYRNYLKRIVEEMKPKKSEVF